MAHGLKCYCCSQKEKSDAYYYCQDCLFKLKNMFGVNRAVFYNKEYKIIENPHHSEHCISCGEFENRRIIDEMFICDKCVELELLQYEHEHTI